MHVSRPWGTTNIISFYQIKLINNIISYLFEKKQVYEAVLGLKSIMEVYKSAMDYTALYVSPLSLNYDYLHKKRASECVEKLTFAYRQMLQYQTNFVDACGLMYNNETAVEWLEVYFTPQFDRLYSTLLKIKELSDRTNDWRPRPLPVTLKQYQRL